MNFYTEQKNTRCFILTGARSFSDDMQQALFSACLNHEMAPTGVCHAIAPTHKTRGRGHTAGHLVGTSARDKVTLTPIRSCEGPG